MRLEGCIRVSRVGGREGESFISPEVQRGQIETWAKLRGATITRWHTDLDQSGQGMTRPGLEEAIRRCEAGLADGIVVAKIDRFARTLPGALETIKRLDAAGAQFVSVAEGIDPTTPAGKMMQRLMLILAEFELDRIRESWRTAQERAVARGVHIASASPTGYDRTEDGRLEPNEHAAAIGDAFRMRTGGAGWGEVCRFLEARSVRGPYGGERWSRKAVKRMLSNRVYLGEARSGLFANPHAHPPIIDSVTFAAVQEEPQEVVRGEGALLSGMLRCAGCGFALKADWMRDRSGERLRLYRCRGDHGMGRCEARASVLGRVLEPRVEAWFLRFVGDVEIRGAALTAERSEAEAVLISAEAEVALYRDQEIASLLGKERYMEGLRARVEAAETARQALGAISPVLPSREVIEDAWPSLSVPERRRLLAAAVDVIFIRSGRSLPIHTRVALFEHGSWPISLPGPGRPNAPRSVVWSLLPERARMALAHDLGEDRGD